MEYQIIFGGDILTFDRQFYADLTDKLYELGCSDPTFGPICADLNDLAEASGDYLDVISKLLKVDTKDSDSVLDILIKMKTIMEHFEYHINSGLPLINKLIDSID